VSLISPGDELKQEELRRYFVKMNENAINKMKRKYRAE
jgi:hypothetical protein